MNKKSFETTIYSVVGILALLGILLAVNVLTGALKQRVDLTHEKAYTLSSGTRAILKKLDTPVKIRYYYSRNAELTSDTIYLKTYAQHVLDLLEEYKQAAGGKIILEQLNPEPLSDAEDSARLDGVEGQLLPTGEKFYLGLSISLLDAKEAIPFLSPSEERLLEYKVTRAISRVVTPEKPVIGIMSPLPIFGQPMNPMMMQTGQQSGQEPWVFVNELKQGFDVKQVDMNSDKIDDSIKVLVVVHPRDISEAAQYAIDQFIMRGGRLVAFLDATSVVDSRGQNPMMGQMPGGGSSLDKLLKAWGVQFDSSKVVADLNYKMRLRGRNGQPTDAPAFLDVVEDGINKNDVATSELGDVWLPFCGAFTGTPVDGLKQTILLKSTKDSQLVEGMMAAMSEEGVIKDFKPSGTEYALAIRLAGKFKSAFPDGKPKDKPEENKDAAKPEDKPASSSLKETKGDNVVVLFGDSDMLYDQFALRQEAGPMGLTFVRPANNNLDLAQNIIEQMTGDSNLIDLRSRATLNRPFTRINEMQAKAQEMYQSKIKELQDSLQETRQKLSELEQKRGQGSQRFIISPEEQAAIDNFRKKEAETNKKLKEEQKQLAHEIVALENTLKWVNILGTPAVVAVSGICIAAFKRKRTSAK